jgi:hypothetical protein
MEKKVFQTDTEQIGFKPALVNFLSLQKDENIFLGEFTASKVRGASFTLSVRKFKDIPGTHKSNQIDKLVISDRELEEGIIWTNNARNSVIGGRYYDSEQIFKLSAKVQMINDFLDQQFLSWLSEGEVTVDEIYTADENYKVDVMGIPSTPSLIQLKKIKFLEDGNKKSDALTISGYRFTGLYFDTRIEGKVQQIPIKETLERNIDVIFKVYELDTMERFSSIGE